MSISPIGPNSPITRPQGGRALEADATSPVTVGSTLDSVEISDSARYLGEIKALPEIRQDKVDAARLQIAAGTFETPARINGTVDRLLTEMRA